MSDLSGIAFHRKESVRQLTENFPILVEFSQEDDGFQIKCAYKQGSKIEKGLAFFLKCVYEICEAHQFCNIDMFLHYPPSQIPRSKNEALALIYFSMAFDFPVYFYLSY
ncbi:MAG: hypothetical protein VKL39_23985 [Leptolyngbyaceae bacterium]|nr:hypothetical protein [Leptolyngbyaceae bacterium]